MRIHGNMITEATIRDAARERGVMVTGLSRHGLRKRARSLGVTLEGSSPRCPNGGASGAGTGYAATWDEWGIFLAALFRADDSLTIPRAYEDAEHFGWSTCYRYDKLTRDAQHRTHRWEVAGMAATGSYRVEGCECGAMRRFLAHGHQWAEIAA